MLFICARYRDDVTTIVTLGGRWREGLVWAQSNHSAIRHATAELLRDYPGWTPAANVRTRLQDTFNMNAAKTKPEDR